MSSAGYQVKMPALISVEMGARLTVPGPLPLSLQEYGARNPLREILIIDDETRSLQPLSMMAHLYGFRTVVARTIEAGVRQIRRTSPAAILMRFDPEQDRAVQAELAELGAEAPIIQFTRNLRDLSRILHERGEQQVLLDPSDPDIVFDLLDRLA